MKSSITALIVFLSFMAFGQASLDDIKFNVFQNLNSTANQNYIRLMNESATGESTSALFEFDDWTAADVESTEGERLHLDSLNYHLEDENMFFVHKGKMYFLYPSKVLSIHSDGRTFIPVKQTNERFGHDSYAYYELLVQGDLYLLKKTLAEKYKVNNHPMGISHGVETYDYRMKTALFYSSDDFSDIQELPRSKKNIIKLFKRNRNRMVEYARENNISPKSEADMVRMFEYYNSIRE